MRAYHLVPEAASKANGVAFHLRARGLRAGDAFAVGDSREDLSCAPQVGTFWLVANAARDGPAIREAMAQYDNVRVAEASHGAGRLRGGRHDAGRAALAIAVARA